MAQKWPVGKQGVKDRSITPLVTNGFSHFYHLNESTFIFRSVISFFVSFSDENQTSKQKSPRWDAAFGGVTSVAIQFAYVP